MTIKDRNKLSDSIFGIPNKRKYPLTDEEHVRKAVQMFDYAGKDDKDILAENIVKRANELGMDWHNWHFVNEFYDIHRCNCDDEEINRVFKACQQLHDKWSKFKYGIRVEDGSYNIPSAEYFNKHYRFLSDGFVKYGIGVCWDYVSYGNEFLNKKHIEHSCYFILTDTPPNYDTHTIIVCKASDKFVYVESSFKMVDDEINGVAIFDDITDVFKFVTSRMFLCNDNYKKFSKFKYDVYKFDEEPPAGSTDSEYMDWMINNAEIVYQDEAVHNDKSNKHIQEASLFNTDTFEIIDANIMSKDDYDDTKVWKNVDDLIAPLLQVCNRKGYKTKFSCSGHPINSIKEHDGSISRNVRELVNTYICIDGKYNFENIPKGWTLETDNPPGTIFRYNHKEVTSDMKYSEYLEAYSNIIKQIKILCDYFSKLPNAENNRKEKLLWKINQF